MAEMMSQCRMAVLFTMLSLCSAAEVPAQNAQIGMEQFDRWIFQGLRSNQSPMEALKARMSIEIERIELALPLSDSQRDQVELAGIGDIKRFNDDVQRARREFLALGDKLNQNNINEAYQIAVPLQQRLNQGLFGDDSLMRKVTRGMIEGEQAAAYRQREERRRKERSKVAVQHFVVLVSRQFAMTGEQREQLTEYLTDHVTLQDPEGRYAFYEISYRLSKLPREELQSIFDDAQWEAFGTVIDRGRGMEMMLRQQGVLDAQ